MGCLFIYSFSSYILALTPPMCKSQSQASGTRQRTSPGARLHWYFQSGKETEYYIPITISNYCDKLREVPIAMPVYQGPHTSLRVVAHTFPFLPPPAAPTPRVAGSNTEKSLGKNPLAQGRRAGGGRGGAQQWYRPLSASWVRWS